MCASLYLASQRDFGCIRSLIQRGLGFFMVIIGAVDIGSHSLRLLGKIHWSLVLVYETLRQDACERSSC